MSCKHQQKNHVCWRMTFWSNYWLKLTIITLLIMMAEDCLALVQVMVATMMMMMMMQHGCLESVETVEQME